MFSVKKGNVTFNPTQNKHLGLVSIINRFRLINPFHLVAAVCLISLGFSVVFLSMFGYLQPLWIATLMSMAGSVSAMLGAYILYDIFNYQHRMNSLLKEAIHRVIHSQN